ncbi:MAG TPA: hypothetical protein VL754_09385 [Verrucomicrobiae bacterium]|jgi:hypothetical protein|nr:hypothetical protein [Verrucomicrobiae bacterium]
MSTRGPSLDIKSRLHVLLSREARTAVVIRRGPSKKVLTVGWNRSDDTFTVGQWLSGRIYERRCDLSPDGKYMIYFALSGAWKSEAKGSWTAVSRAPYLKAICLWAKGDAWNGGGLFVSNRRYCLNDGYGHSLVRDTKEVERDLKDFPQGPVANNECLGIYYPRLLRDGWKLMAAVENPKWHRADVFEKHCGDVWLLRKTAKAGLGNPAGKGVYYDEHELVNSQSGKSLAFPQWEWADVDGERLCWAEAGKIFAARLGSNGPIAVKELHDFNNYEYERIKAPY